jgi:hypothetical protein
MEPQAAALRAGFRGLQRLAGGLVGSQSCGWYRRLQIGDASSSVLDFGKIANSASGCHPLFIVARAARKPCGEGEQETGSFLFRTSRGHLVCHLYWVGAHSLLTGNIPPLANRLEP